MPNGIWCLDEDGARPLVLYSHHSRGNRRSTTCFTTHLASRGSLVAALDHSEVVAPETAGNVEGFIANRVPEVPFLLDYMLAGVIPCTARPDPDRIAIIGHSAGGWPALALRETDTRIQAVVALAPGGPSQTQAGNYPRHPHFQLAAASGNPVHPRRGRRPHSLAGMHELSRRAVAQPTGPRVFRTGSNRSVPNPTHRFREVNRNGWRNNCPR